MKPRPAATISARAASDLWSEHYGKCDTLKSHAETRSDLSAAHLAERDLAVYVCDRCGWQTPVFYVGDDW